MPHSGSADDADLLQDLKVKVSLDGICRRGLQTAIYQNYLQRFSNTGVLLGGPEKLCTFDWHDGRDVEGEHRTGPGQKHRRVAREGEPDSSRWYHLKASLEREMHLPPSAHSSRSVPTRSRVLGLEPERPRQVNNLTENALPAINLLFGASEQSLGNQLIKSLHVLVEGGPLWSLAEQFWEPRTRRTAKEQRTKSDKEGSGVGHACISI